MFFRAMQSPHRLVCHGAMRKYGDFYFPVRYKNVTHITFFVALLTIVLRNMSQNDLPPICFAYHWLWQDPAKLGAQEENISNTRINAEKLEKENDLSAHLSNTLHRQVLPGKGPSIAGTACASPN